MSAYRLTSEGIDGPVVIRTIDGAGIPNDNGNRDWRIFQEWLAAGGVPDPYVGEETKAD